MMGKSQRAELDAHEIPNTVIKWTLSFTITLQTEQ